MEHPPDEFDHLQPIRLLRDTLQLHQRAVQNLVDQPPRHLLDRRLLLRRKVFEIGAGQLLFAQVVHLLLQRGQGGSDLQLLKARQQQVHLVFHQSFSGHRLMFALFLVGLDHLL